MKDALRIFWQALKEAWDELFILMLMNIVTALLAIPVVTLPPALAGLWNAANMAANERAVSWSDYWGGFRRYFWKSWGLALINLLVTTVLISNVWFYGQEFLPFALDENIKLGIKVFFAMLLGLWLLYQMYPLAMLLEQEDQRLKTALRNGALIYLTQPVFTIVLGLLLALVAGISMLAPALWAIVTLALVAVVCNKAVLHLLEPYREQIESLNQEETPVEQPGIQKQDADER